MTIEEKVEYALRLLKDIEQRKINVVPRALPSDVYAGDVVYDLSNGGQLIIFNDCDSWDYIDSIVFPDGQTMTYDEIANSDSEGRHFYQELYNYIPPKEILAEVYRF